MRHRSLASLLSLALLFEAAGARRVTAADETYLLTPVLKPADVSHVQLTFEAGGKLSIVDGEKQIDLDMSVKSVLVYDEVLMSLADEARQSVRHYARAEADIDIKDKGLKPELRADRRTIVVDAQPASTTLFSPEGPLTPEELDLIDVPGNTLLLDQLLPTERVSLRSTWQHDGPLMAGLLGLDTVGACNVTSVLVDVDDDAAKCQLSGTVNGAVSGVATEMQIKAKYTYHRRLGRVTWFALAVRETRGNGYVTPGIDATSKIQIKITPIDASAELTPERLAGVDCTATPANSQFWFQPPHDPFRLACDRRWHSVAERPGHLALRLIDRGELIAQCNLGVPAPAAPDKLPALSQFQDDVQKALGDRFERFTGASEADDPQGIKIYRVVAQGTVSELPIEWHYYLLIAPDGTQISLACTVEQALAERLGTADADLIAGLQIVPKTTETASRETPAKQ